MASSNFNELQVYETLSKVVPILNTHRISYWFEGSIIPTSANGFLYRKVNDLDILIDKDKADTFTQELKKIGYKQKDKNIYRVSEHVGVRVFIHKSLLEIGYFSISISKSGPYEIKAGPLRITISRSVLTKTGYQFNDIDFIGIPLEGAYTFALLSKGNPKRVHEFELYERLKIKPFKWPIYDLYLWGVKCNWLIDLLNISLITLGKVRVWFRKPYDPWR